ncbi:chromate transporter [Streptomyces sp. NBC_01296]|uniref:chromate transporter n=1 Tax=Streptomyces sp. NBC_01296 TaxID=2903816 RepID=UPI003FA3DBA6|nr:hypothetical protein OG513_36560 [Streptomyces sp. NBC_00998]
MERLRGNRSVFAALSGITAAVVGVIASLGLYFAFHTLFKEVDETGWGSLHLLLPDLASIRPSALAITAAALLMIFRLRWSVLRTLGVCAALGLASAAVQAL